MSLVLASASSIRRDMLEAAGVAFTVRPANVDEGAIKAGHVGDGATLAASLADLKALAGSAKDPDALVIGADSVVQAPDGRLLNKPATRDHARAQLLSLRARTHRISSAASLARDGQLIWRGMEECHLTVRPFSAAWLDDYLEREWDHIRWTVGCYRFEALGVQLFSEVAGSHHAVLGLPLVPLLGALRSQQVLAS